MGARPLARQLTPEVDRVELLIDGGTVVDGTGAPGFAGSVAVSGGLLRIPPEGVEQPVAERVIDARGRVVAPGLIDLHSHSGLMILADPLHEPKVRQGVTTEIVGVDGLSYVPLPSQADLDAPVEMNAGLDGAPAVAIDWINDRGRLADGLAADIVVFDSATVRSNATYDEPRRYPDGDRLRDRQRYRRG